MNPNFGPGECLRSVPENKGVRRESLSQLRVSPAPCGPWAPSRTVSPECLKCHGTTFDRVRTGPFWKGICPDGPSGRFRERSLVATIARYSELLLRSPHIARYFYLRKVGTPPEWCEPRILPSMLIFTQTLTDLCDGASILQH